MKKIVTKLLFLCMSFNYFYELKSSISVRSNESGIINLHYLLEQTLTFN